jgi:lipid-A-disaccharide synthase
MIVAGEASADLYGANLARAIRGLAPGAEIVGVGGANMAAAGVRLVADARDLSVMGFTTVVASLGRIRRVFYALWRILYDDPPDALVPIDLPDFNLILAGRAKELGVPVCYYISPQVWAWRKGRVRKIARRADRMVVAFPFEKALYAAHGLDARFLGHPLVEIAMATLPRAEALARFGLDPDRPVVVVMPGSRRGEVRHLLPPLVAAVDLLAARFPDLQFALPVAPTLSDDDLAPHLAAARTPIALVRGDVYELLAIARVGLITSGTATLEAALFALPMVIVYRGSRANVALARRLVKVDFIGLPNLIAGSRIVPELIQEDAAPERIAAEAGALLADPAAWERMHADLARVRDGLTGEGTSRAVAEVVLGLARDGIARRAHGA